MNPQVLTMLSVPWIYGSRLCAIVGGNQHDALNRLRADDPVWFSFGVFLHWTHAVDTESSRLRVRDRLKVWVVFKP